MTSDGLNIAILTFRATELYDIFSLVEKMSAYQKLSIIRCSSLIIISSPIFKQRIFET